MLIRFLILTVCLTFVYPWDPRWVIDYTASNLGNQTKSTKMLILINRIPHNWDKVNTFLDEIRPRLLLPTFVVSERVDFQVNTIADKDAFTLIFLEYFDVETFEIARLLLMKMHYNPFLVVIIVRQKNLNFLHFLFDYMWRHGFILPIVYYQDEFGKNHVYLHFLNNTMNDVTGIAWRDLPGSTRYDMHLQSIVTPIRFDPPRVFFNRKGEVDGSTGKLFSVFAAYINASIKDYPMPGSPNILIMQDLLPLLTSRKIDITMHSYAAVDKIEIGESYPLEIVNWCLMVPVIHEETGNYHTFISQPFQPMVWLLLFITVIVVCFIDALFFKQFSNQFGNYLIYVINILTFTNFPERLQQPSWTLVIYYASIFFFSFFLTLLYTSTLGSILIVSSNIHQIDSEDDLIARKLPVMTIHLDKEYLFKYQDFSKDFKELFVSVDEETYWQYKINYNASFAYPVTEDKWYFVDKIQKNLKKKIFRYSKICFGYYQLGFPMQSDSPLSRDMETFIHMAYDSGLIKYFKDIGFENAILEGYMGRLQDEETNFEVGITFSQLQYIFYGMAVLYGLAFGLLLWEVLRGEKGRRLVENIKMWFDLI